MMMMTITPPMKLCTGTFLLAFEMSEPLKCPDNHFHWVCTGL